MADKKEEKNKKKFNGKILKTFVYKKINYSQETLLLLKTKDFLINY